jgi:hypothetical protein
VNTVSRVVPAYDSLPAPFDPSTLGDSVEAVSGALAKIIMSGDPKAVLPAFERALLDAGIGIRDSKTGALLFADQLRSNSGIAFMDWEVVALARLSATGVTLSMGDLAASVAFSELGFNSGLTLDIFYHHGDSTSAPGASSASLWSRAFWRQFVADLGSAGESTTQNLWSHKLDALRADARVNQVQAALLMLRFAAELIAYLQLHPVTGAGTGGGGSSPGPCTFDESASTIMDVTALASTYGIGQLLEYLDDLEVKGAGTYAKISGAVSAALAIVKYIATSSALETTLDMEENEPLERWKNADRSHPGEKKTLRGTARYNIGNWSALNCARIALNAANADFNLPSEGPLADVAVAWGYDIGSTDFGSTVLDNSAVEFYSLDGGWIKQMKTDANGLSRIGLEGAPRSEPIKEPARSNPKTVRITFQVALTSEKLFNDILSGIGVATAGPFAPVIMTLEMLTRIPLQGRARSIAVQDWLGYGSY